MNWHFDIDGKPYDVVAESLPNGKVAIRANGRIVAPPQSSERVDCRITLGTTVFRLLGSGDELRMEPVVVEAVLPPPAPPPVQREDRIEFRAILFIVIGSVLFVAGTCTFVGASASRLGLEQQIEVENRTEIENVMKIHGAIRFGILLIAAIGGAAIAGGAMLYRRIQSAPMFLAVVCWAIAAGPALSLWIVDVLAHRQFALLADSTLAVRFLAGFHTIAVILIITFALFGGVLFSVLAPGEIRLDATDGS
jgi:hypothetical protein